MAEEIILTLGSNIDPERSLREAVRRLSAVGEIVAQAPVYRNPALGTHGQPIDQPAYFNTAVHLRSGLDLHALREALRRIEKEMGRVRSSDKFAAREIDLDICLYGDRVVRDDQLELPDPDLLTLAHVAVPVAALVPEWIHPITGKSMQQIAKTILETSTSTLIQVEANPGIKPSGSSKSAPGQLDRGSQ